jgi:DNA-binding IscR family transcriptional regulator
MEAEQPPLSETERAVLEVLAAAPGPLRSAVIARQAGYSPDHTRAMLARLRLRGLLRKVAGGYRLARE